MAKIVKTVPEPEPEPEQEELCKHEWFPIAIDEELRFAFYECVHCTETLWRNTSPTYNEDSM